MSILQQQQQQTPNTFLSNPQLAALTGGGALGPLLAAALGNSPWAQSQPQTPSLQQQASDPLLQQLMQQVIIEVFVCKACFSLDRR